MTCRNIPEPGDKRKVPRPPLHGLHRIFYQYIDQALLLCDFQIGESPVKFCVRFRYASLICCSLIAKRLRERKEDLLRGRVIVLGLPRGGLPVAYPIAKDIQCPLDVVLVHYYIIIKSI
jgi:hypothetical protein